MPKYSAIHHKVTLFGDMFGGSEIWSTGFALGQSNGGDEGDPPTAQQAQLIAEEFNKFFTHGQNGIHGNYRFLGAKVSHVNTLGQADAALTQFYNLPVPGVGIGAGVCMPPQVSVVATLATVKQRGKGSKGRMYIPGVSAGIDGSAKLPSNVQTNLANTLKTFLDTVSASLLVPGVPVLMSAESPGVPFKAAEMNMIASVRVGNVYDTQRRRRNALIEQYVSAALA